MSRKLTLGDWLHRRQPQRIERVVAYGPAHIPATVEGVYGTVDTDCGDYDVGSPSRIRIDCEAVWFEFPFAPVRTLTMRAYTLRLGTTVVTTQISPPVKVRPYDRVTIVMPIVVGELEAVDGPVPAWAQEP